MLRAWLILEEIKERSVITSMLMLQMLKHLLYGFSLCGSKLGQIELFRQIRVLKQNSFAFRANMQHNITTIKFTHVYFYYLILCVIFTEIVHPKIKVLSSFTHTLMSFHLHDHCTNHFNDTFTSFSEREKFCMNQHSLLKYLFAFYRRNKVRE